MPGVVVQSGLRTGPSTPAGDPVGRWFVAGITERGPVGVPVKVTSLAQFISVFGARQSYSGSLYDGIQTYFEEGGTECWVSRVVGASAVNASLSLQDKGGTPLPTLKISAVNPGAFASQYTVTVTAGTTGTFTLTVTDTVSGSTESYPNLPDVPSAVTALTASAYVRGQDLHSTNTPSSNQIPALIAATALASGDDNRASVNSAAIVAAFAVFGAGLGSGDVSAPGYALDQVGTGLIAHAKANRRVAVLSGVSTASVAALVTLGATITQDGQFAGLFGPWVTIPDGAGNTRLIDPTGYVAGVRARAMASQFWTVPAGQKSAARFVTGTAYPVDESANNTLAAGGVSGIVTYPNSVELMGWYSLSTDKVHYKLLRTQDLMNSINNKLQAALHVFVWDDVDGRGNVFGEIESIITGVLQPIADAGGLYALLDDDGSEIDPGYAVTVDNSNNTVVSLSGNTVNGAVAIRPDPSLETLIISSSIADLTSTLTS